MVAAKLVRQRYRRYGEQHRKRHKEERKPAPELSSHIRFSSVRSDSPPTFCPSRRFPPWKPKFFYEYGFPGGGRPAVGPSAYLGGVSLGSRMYAHRRMRSAHTGRRLALFRPLIHPSAWKGCSANFVLRGFSEVH